MGIILQIESTFVVKALKNIEAICTKTFFLESFRFFVFN